MGMEEWIDTLSEELTVLLIDRSRIEEEGACEQRVECGSEDASLQCSGAATDDVLAL